MKVYKWFNFKNVVWQASGDSQRISLRTSNQAQLISESSNFSFLFKDAVKTAMTQESQLELETGSSESASESVRVFGSTLPDPDA